MSGADVERIRSEIRAKAEFKKLDANAQMETIELPLKRTRTTSTCVLMCDRDFHDCLNMPGGAVE